jgi:glutathione S-transferase
MGRCFQCAMRVQMNTLEQMITFLPALWMCAFFLNDRWAALGGAAWIVGRIAYALGYYKDPSKRSFGFMLTMFANIGLMCGAAVGLLTF